MFTWCYKAFDREFQTLEFPIIRMLKVNPIVYTHTIHIHQLQIKTRTNSI